MKKEDKYKIPIYGGTLVVVIVTTSKEIVDMLKDDTLVDCTGVAYTDEMKTNSGYHNRYTIILNEEYGNLNYGVVAHEALHITHMVFENKGIRPSTVNDEPQAYLIEWVVNKVFKSLDKYKIEVNF
jgi:hypothetical protein